MSLAVTAQMGQAGSSESKHPSVGRVAVQLLSVSFSRDHHSSSLNIAYFTQGFYLFIFNGISLFCSLRC